MPKQIEDQVKDVANSPMMKDMKKQAETIKQKAEEEESARHEEL